MYPVIQLGFFPIPVYGLCAVIGFSLGIVFALLRSKIYNYPKDVVLYCGIFAGIGIVIGAKLLYFITSLPAFIRDYDEIIASNYDGLAVMEFLFGGFVFYGGLIGAIFMVFVFSKVFKLDFLTFTNIIVPVVPLVHAVGRIGCFFGGCCYGIHYEGPLSVQFPDNPLIDGLGDFPRFPVQLVESTANFVLFAALFYYTRKPRKLGLPLGIYLISYTIIRFTLEFFRGDGERGILLGVSTSQWISLLLIPIGIYLVVRKPKIAQ